MRKWLIGLLMILGLYAGFAQAETYVVAIDGTGDFQTLTEAVAASSTGDTILLRAGVYGEQETFPIALDHAVTIEGEDGAVLDSPRFKTMLSVTADGVTLIPVSRLSFGFGCGGGDYGKQPDKVGAAAAAGVRVEPMAFLVVKDGVTRMLPVGTPAITTVDRVVEMVPQVMDRVESFIDKKREKADF